MCQQFNSLAQGVPTRERSEGGLGIGLALVRGFVELHGGRIEGRSEGLGRGSVFTMTLPATCIAPNEEVAGMQEWDDRLRSSHRATVLIADDNRDAANFELRRAVQAKPA